MRVETRQATLLATDGESITVRVPIGAIVEPSPTMRAIMEQQQNPENWKKAVAGFWTCDEAEAREYADCLDFFCGGHEWQVFEGNATKYCVTSKGYYHYVVA